MKSHSEEMIDRRNWHAVWEVEGDYGQLYEHQKWKREIPKIPLPDGCVSVRTLPPFAGAVARIMFYGEGEGNHVSVYFDAYDCLGAEGEPYWEIYPDTDGENARFLMGQEAEMSEAISAVLLEVA